MIKYQRYCDECGALISWDDSEYDLCSQGLNLKVAPVQSDGAYSIEHTPVEDPILRINYNIRSSVGQAGAQKTIGIPEDLCSLECLAKWLTQIRELFDEPILKYIRTKDSAAANLKDPY